MLASQASQPPLEEGEAALSPVGVKAGRSDGHRGDGHLVLEVFTNVE
jgi:hypothetical protein